jgi:hypothetical protein
VNVPSLLRKLREFDHREDWYLGKPSIPEPLEILDRDNMQVRIEFVESCKLSSAHALSQHGCCKTRNAMTDSKKENDRAKVVSTGLVNLAEGAAAAAMFLRRHLRSFWLTNRSSLSAQAQVLVRHRRRRLLLEPGPGKQDGSRGRRRQV